MLLELKLTKDDEDFGPEGTEILLHEKYIVGVSRHGNGSKILVNLSDLKKFKSIYVSQPYQQWYVLKFNP